MKENKNILLYGVIDRIEDNKIVVINLEHRQGTLYLPKKLFTFSIYEGLWLKIVISPDYNKSQEMKLKISALQKELLERNKKDNT